MKRKSFVLTGILSLLAVIALYFFFREGPKKELIRAYQAYANADIHLLTEQGEFLFFPNGCFRLNGKSYRGLVNIELASYDTLHKYFRGQVAATGKAFPSVQLGKSIISCWDSTKTNRLSVWSGGGYKVLLLLPFDPNDVERPKGKAFANPQEALAAIVGDDFLGLNKHLEKLPPGTSLEQLELWGKSLPDWPDRLQAQLAGNKIKSLETLNQILKQKWITAGQSFLRNFTRENGGELKTDYDRSGDLLISVPYYGLVFPELFKDGEEKISLHELFEENNIRDCLLIADWTGSMNRYKREIKVLIDSLQVRKTIRYLVLYNDMYNSTGDEVHPIGPSDSYEGLYWLDSITSFAQVSYKMDEAESYHGGIIEENDLEALIESMLIFGGANYSFAEVVMIVDNNAPPRDTWLLDKLPTSKRVNVIACSQSADDEVQPAYRQIANATGGELILKY